LNAFAPSIDRKLISLKKLIAKLDGLKKQNRRIVFTNGCFDIIHRGHVEYLQKARQLGDFLIIGLNSDASIHRIKGPERPLNKEADRAAVLGAMSCVDYVVIFDEDTPQELLSQLRPDILVKGADYKLEEVVGREFVKKVVLIDYLKGYSTTNLINKINEK